nr:ABC transporter transmembrane domain-containing protein [Fimbriimonadaceae bacterium]
MDDSSTPDSKEVDEVLPPVKSEAVRRLLRLVVPHKARLFVAGIFMILASGLSLALPLFAKEGVDRVIKSLEEKAPPAELLASLDSVVLVVLGLIIVSGILEFSHYVMVSKVGNRIVADLRSRLFSHLERLPVGFFDKTRSGELGSRISTDTTQVQQTLTSDLVELIPNVLTLVGGIGVALFIDWRLTLVVVTLLAVVIALFVFFGRKLRDLNKLILSQTSEAVGLVSEALSNIRLVKAFSREPHEEVRAKARFENIYKLGVQSSVWEAAMGVVASIGFISLLVGVIWYGGRNVVMGVSTPGSLIAFFMTVTIIAGPMGSLASLYTRLQRAL